MEILAPVGNIEALHAAISSGANAVYLGMGKFNARAKADNFNESNLADSVRYAHIFGCKVYLTMNTLIKDNEMSEALDVINFAKSCKIDAFIVQDLGLVSQINSTMSDIVLHSSTQMGIHNLEGAKIAEKLGFSRIILARETLLEDIRKIHDETNLEIEFFVQGALCVAFSGNCYFSSLVSGYSGNRGKCMQLCRKKYKITKGNDSKTGYYLSPKDLCLAHNVNELKEAGVCSLKIEGRLRSPEYVSECVKVYQKAISSNIDENDIDRLKVVFNRGNYCEGYLKEPTANLIYPKIQGNIGLACGTVTSINNNLANLSLFHPLAIGDGVKYLRDGIEVGAGLISDLPTTTFVGNVQKGDSVNLTSSINLSKAVSCAQKKLLLNMHLTLKINQKPLLKIYYNGLEVIEEGEQLIQKANKCALKKDSIITSVTKLGETNFICNDISLDMDDNIFYAVSLLNELRRSAILKLENIILYGVNAYKTNSMSDILCINWLKLTKINNVFLQFDNVNQIKLPYVDYSDFVVFNPPEYNMLEINAFLKIAGEKAILNLPLIARGEDINILKNVIDNCGINKFIANNIYALVLCKDKTVIAGFGMNILNNFYDCTKICSIESEKHEYSNNSILYSYGKIPLMTFCHCPNKHFQNSCKNCAGYDNLSITDEKGFTFNLRRVKVGYCYCQLLNSLPLNLLSEKKNNSNIFIDFTSCQENEINEVLFSFRNNIDKYNVHTHGNFNKILK